MPSARLTRPLESCVYETLTETSTYSCSDVEIAGLNSVSLSVCKTVPWRLDCGSKQRINCSSRTDASEFWCSGWFQVHVLCSSTTVRKYLWPAVHEISTLPFGSQWARPSLSEDYADPLNCLLLFPFVQSIHSSALLVATGSKTPNLWSFTHLSGKTGSNLWYQRYLFQNSEPSLDTLKCIGSCRK